MRLWPRSKLAFAVVAQYTMEAIRVASDATNRMSVPEKIITGPNTVRLLMTASSHVSQFFRTAKAMLVMKGEVRTSEQTVKLMTVSNDVSSDCYSF